MPEAQFPGISLSGSSVSENPTLLGSSVNLALRVEDELTTLHPCRVGGLLSDADHEVQPSIVGKRPVSPLLVLYDDLFADILSRL